MEKSFLKFTTIYSLLIISIDLWLHIYNIREFNQLSFLIYFCMFCIGFYGTVFSKNKLKNNF